MKKCRRQFFRRFVSWILLISILTGMQASFYSFAAEQKRADSKEYQVYLADYLVQYPPLRKDLGFDMLHRRLVREIKNQEGFLGGVKTYRFLTDKGSFVFQDKTQLYKQVILEILQVQLRTKEQKENLEKSYNFWKNTILENALRAMDFGPEVMDSESTLRTALANADLSKVGDTFWKSTIFGEQMTFSGGASVSGQFSAETKAGIGLCAGMVLNTTKNLLEYTEKMALYMAASEYRQGTLEFLELMYRQSSDPELLVALRTVIDSIRGLGSQDMAAAVADLEYGFQVNTLIDILSGVIQQWCGAAGLLVSGTVILTELVFNSGQIGELALLLEAQVAVEDAVRAGLRHKLNSYHGGYESAIALNAGAMMLYDTYEYGLSLANSYAEAVLDQGFINQMGAKIAEGIGKGIYGPNYYPKDNSYSFKELSSAYENMVKVNRTVFDSVWEMYLEDFPVKEAVQLVWEEKGIPVQGITMEDEPLRIDLESSVQVPWAVSARIQPANAENPRILYSSTDPTIVEVDEVGYLTPHKEGRVYIEAVTEEGGYQARRQVIVTRGTAEQISVSFDESKDYSDCYRKNKDGITLTKPIRGEVTMTRNGKTYVERDGIIPSYIDGQPVTEVDFAEWWRQMKKKHGSYIRNVQSDRGVGKAFYPYETEVVFIGTSRAPFVIPDTVKRIAPECFAGNQFDAGIVFGENLKSIGEGAFRGTTFDFTEKSDSGAPVITIPDNVTELGKSVFEGAFFEECQVVISGASREIIPENFMKDARELAGVILECPNLKIIEAGAFGRANGKCPFPDGKLPENLIEIGEGAFQNAMFENGNGRLVFPKTLRRIGKSAFQGVRCKEVILPESVELIGETAFAGGTMESVSCFGTEPKLAKGTMDSRAFSGCENLLQIQIPMNIGTLGEDILQNSMRIKRIEWPAGLSSIGKQTFRTLVDRPIMICVRGNIRGERQLLTNDWFHFRGGRHGEEGNGKYYDENFNMAYLEIPGAFAEQLNLGAFDGLADYYQYSKDGERGDGYVWLDTLMICGTVKEIIPGAYAKSFEDFVGSAVYARDEEGNVICLYQREKTGNYYKKYSRAFYENWEDYQIVFPAETEAVTQQSFENSSVSVRVNADAKTVGRMENRPIEIYLWQNEEGENRGKALGEFLEFEDLYLKQPRYFYFKIGVNDGEQLLTSYPGEYQISFKIGKDWEEEKTAAYHIDEDGLITRLSGQVCGSGPNKEYKVLTKNLGSFAVVHLTCLVTEMKGSFSEELHQLLIPDEVEKTDGEEGEAEDGGKGEIEKPNAEKPGKKPSRPGWVTNAKNWLQEKKEEITELWKPKKEELEPDEEEKKKEPGETEPEETEPGKKPSRPVWVTNAKNWLQEKKEGITELWKPKNEELEPDEEEMKKEPGEKPSRPVWVTNMKNWLQEKKEGISGFWNEKKEKPDPEKEGKGKELEGQEAGAEDRKEEERIEENQKKEAETKEGSLWFIFAGIGILILIGTGVSALSKKKKRSNKKRNGRPRARK